MGSHLNTLKEDERGKGVLEEVSVGEEGGGREEENVNRLEQRLELL